jgi:hypothetical protein
MNESFREKVLAVQAKYHLPSWDAAFRQWMEEEHTGRFSQEISAPGKIEARWDSPTATKTALNADSGAFGPEQVDSTLKSPSNDPAKRPTVAEVQAANPTWSPEKVQEHMWLAHWT